MKKIQLNNGASIDLPDCWEDLTREQILFTGEVLNRLFSGTITPGQARIEMLIRYTGYRPSRKITDPDEREIINFNLLKLSEQLNFAFAVEENVIHPDFSFKRNPLPELTIDGQTYPGKIFNLDITAKTNITAKEFSDAFDLFVALNKMAGEAQKEECLNQLCAILYPASASHRENLISGQIEKMRKIGAVEKFIILSWFTGIVRFYTGHPVYSIIFERNKKSEDSGEKINIGMNEILLTLQKEGYENPNTMNLNDYFDAQLKYLKDIIHKALGDGIKPEKLSAQTGIPLSTINKLS
jgi:hypothetical protein